MAPYKTAYLDNIFLRKQHLANQLVEICKRGPPSASPSRHVLHSMALLFISFPSPLHDFSYQPSTPFSSHHHQSPSRSPLRITELVCCSAKKGQHSIGTHRTLSSVEFHPLCVRNAPTAGWQSTSSCGHQFAMSPSPSSPLQTRGSTAASPLTSRSDDPQKLVLAIREPPRELYQLLVRHDRYATEIHVDNGPGLLFPTLLEPTELSGRGDASGEEGEGADGVDGRHDSRHGFERRALEIVERVEEDSRRMGVRSVCAGRSAP
ncbi:hypothetical protein ACMD2_18885 [Ananas comosus]|uniref:Uncharacterized protein n=1 Tax=Ananas comosus TaxID=4615 RepID=A0A199VFW7_ANACO|nr:hypothetical protein ACMD2_18885 [Ananas comosus]